MSGLISWPGRVGQNKSPDMLEYIWNGLRGGGFPDRDRRKGRRYDVTPRKIFQKNQELQLSVERELGKLHFIFREDDLGESHYKKPYGSRGRARRALTKRVTLIVHTLWWVLENIVKKRYFLLLILFAFVIANTMNYR